MADKRDGSTVSGYGKRSMAKQNGSAGRTVCLTVLLLLCMLVAAGCAKKAAADSISVKITYTDLRTDTSEGSAENAGKKAELPHFTTAAGQSSKAVDELNDELGTVRDRYDSMEAGLDGTGKDTYMEIRTFTQDAGPYSQVTVAWCCFPLEKGTQGDLMTVAYDSSKDTAVTCREALKMAGLTGDKLTTDVIAAYDRNGTGLVKHTDMEGFVLDAAGTVKSIYMKIRIIDAQTDDVHEAFYSYDPSSGALEPAFTDLYSGE
ncbi:MAG: hypothetical protein LKJ76_10620 [Lachnospiraceae bacterium]|nr:hypothetical protein [Lachnospiraceae bacterium]